MQDVRRMELQPAPGLPDTFLVLLPHTMVEWQSIQGTSNEAHVTLGPLRTTHGLVTAYVRAFDRLFIPYNGPDEPPGFEPENYPLH